MSDYTVINDPNCLNRHVLRERAQTVLFPLTPEIEAIAKELEEKFDQEENCAGLAAPQIGYNQRIIVFAVDDDPNLKKYRPDLTDTISKSIWFNPTYYPVMESKHIDWEACFSVDDIAAKVARYTEVHYEAYTREGQKITGKAKGFLARLIQHEIDHLNGKLFIDYVPEAEWSSKKKLRAERDEIDKKSIENSK